MIAAMILLAIALLLIFFEFFLPGGVLGIAGSLLVVLSIILFAVHSDSALAVIAFIVVAGVLVGLLIRFSLWRIRRGKPGKSIYLNADQEGYIASTFDKSYIGKEGEAHSDLKPAGHIVVEGKRLQAVSKTGYITKGSKITVVGGEGAHLVVKHKETP